MKYILILMTSLFLISCTNTEKSENVPTMLSFQSIMYEYFGLYDPIFETSIKRPGNNSGTILIKKQNLSIAEMNEIKEKIKSNGWLEFENSDSYALYCLDKYQLIGILYPSNLIEKNKIGDEITYDDPNDWTIGLYYNKNGINSCEK